MYKNLSITLVLLAFVSTATAQNPQKSGGSKQSVPELNGRATTLPKPVEPVNSNELTPRGIVRIRVVISETGAVESAEIVTSPVETKFSGSPDTVTADLQRAHPLLEEAALNAAYQARFEPTLINGEPVKVTGIVTYNFRDPAPPKPLEGTPKQISGGVLNGKAKLLPKPIYPEAAKAANATGAVTVQVLIDEAGNVVSAKAVSGHPLLRAESENAALLARFSPTTLQGNPVKVSGVITYNFVQPLQESKAEMLWGLGFIFKLISAAKPEMIEHFGAEGFAEIVRGLSEDVPEELNSIKPLLEKLPAAIHSDRQRLVEEILFELQKTMSSEEIAFLETGIVSGNLIVELASAKIDLELGRTPDVSNLRSSLRELNIRLETTPFEPSSSIAKNLKRLASFPESSDLAKPESLDELFRAIEPIFEAFGDN